MSCQRATNFAIIVTEGRLLWRNRSIAIYLNSWTGIKKSRKKVVPKWQ